MLTNDEVEALIRKFRDLGKSFHDEYVQEYQRIDAIRGHKARMNAIYTMGKDAP